MRIGYTQGTFDVFHIGHLNLLKNAKAQCDYLLVGVNTDELVASYKMKKSIIPLEERMAILAELRCVDEVISCDTLDKESIYQKKHFDAIFIGDDWKGNSRWLATEQQMSKYGVKVIYLPYTQNTSSTLVREKLLEY
mgnify:CR=1 FL=1